MRINPALSGISDGAITRPMVGDLRNTTRPPVTASGLERVAPTDKGQPVGVNASEPITVEGLTLGLIGGTYACFVLALMAYSLAPVLIAVALAFLLAFHSSLVHEIIHGHPTSSRRINDLLAAPPLGLIYPYPLFRESHLAHHRDALLTLPGLDPESFFCDVESWQQMHRAQKILAWINMTLAGRLLLHPMMSFLKMARICVLSLIYGDRYQRGLWVRHLTGCAALLIAIGWLTEVPVWVYLLCAYASHSLISLRAFFEHRPSELVDHRIVVVEGCRLLRLLYLNNNYHATHHRYPGLPWYEVEKRFRSEGGQVIERNGGFYFRGYAAWLKFLVTPVASPVHPFSK